MQFQDYIILIILFFMENLIKHHSECGTQRKQKSITNTYCIITIVVWCLLIVFLALLYPTQSYLFCEVGWLYEFDKQINIQ